MPSGRPSKYKAEYCDRVIEFMAQGLSKEAFAGEIGVHKETIYNWAEKHEAFSDAIKQGEARSRLFWEKMGSAGALGKLPGFNASSWIFNMKNRFGWRDRNEVLQDEPWEIVYRWKGEEKQDEKS